MTDILESSIEIRFGQCVEPKCFKGFDAVILCSYKPGPNSEKLNMESTRLIYKVAQTAGVPFQLFVSSHSVRPDAAS